MNDDESAVRHAKAEGRPQMNAIDLKDWIAELEDRVWSVHSSVGNAPGLERAALNRQRIQFLRALVSGSDRPDSERP